MEARVIELLQAARDAIEYLSIDDARKDKRIERIEDQIMAVRRGLSPDELRGLNEQWSFLAGVSASRGAIVE